MRIWVALAGGLLVIALALGFTLSRSPLVVVGANMPQTDNQTVSIATGDSSACQAHEALPRDTAAVRLALTTNIGARVNVSVLAGARVIARGSTSPGWRGASVTVGLRPLPTSFAPVEICFALSDLNARVGMLGVTTDRNQAAYSGEQVLPGRMRIEYLRASRQSWFSMANAVAWRLGLGRAASGNWNVWLLVTLAIALTTLSIWLVGRELR